VVVKSDCGCRGCSSWIKEGEKARKRVNEKISRGVVGGFMTACTEEATPAWFVEQAVGCHCLHVASHVEPQCRVLNVRWKPLEFQPTKYLSWADPPVLRLLSPCLTQVIEMSNFRVSNSGLYAILKLGWTTDVNCGISKVEDQLGSSIVRGIGVYVHLCLHGSDHSTKTDHGEKTAGMRQVRLEGH